jgi:RNA polymerase sigma-70 factor (ECF subfamily)
MPHDKDADTTERGRDHVVLPSDVHRSHDRRDPGLSLMEASVVRTVRDVLAHRVGGATRAEAVAESGVGRFDGIDTVSQAWIDGLRARGGGRIEKLTELHTLMTRTARLELVRRGYSSNGVDGNDRDDLVEEIASDTLFAVINKLDSYRGATRFTTWAYGFMINTVSAKLVCRACRPLALTVEDQAWERLADCLSTDPGRSAEVRDVLRALRSGIDRALTERQRQVFIAVAFNDARIDDLAVQLGSNRSAVYRTLFDARRKLRAHLEAADHRLPIPHDRVAGEVDHQSVQYLSGSRARPRGLDVSAVDDHRAAARPQPLRDPARRARCARVVSKRVPERVDGRQPMTEKVTLNDLLLADPRDLGCQAGFDFIGQYVELGLAGKDPATAYPGLAAHLRCCPACRLDHDGLLEATRADPSTG